MRYFIHIKIYYFKLSTKNFKKLHFYLKNNKFHHKL